MNRLYGLLVSRAARATSAACFVCGALLLVKRRWERPAAAWPTHDLLRPASLTQRLVRQPGLDSGALRRLCLLTKDPAFCERAMQRRGAVERLLGVLLDSAGRLSHEVECLLAETFANLSCCADCRALMLQHDVDRCLAAWSQRADSARLSLCAAKIRHNLSSHSAALPGDVYLLSSARDDAAVDVVFVNGIDGSVFHTWRPRDVLRHSSPDNDYRACWPRDWLAAEVADARLLGVDVKARAWAWNASCSRPDQRLLQPRAAAVLAQVLAAGLGGRPVVWVAHSMGGLLVKEVLRQAEAAGAAVAASTRGVLFLSTPHRGSTSLRALFRFPLRLCLSAESAELGRDAPLCHLDDWFRDFAARRRVSVLDVREEQATRVGALFSVLLVERNGPDLGEAVTVPCDHVTISKPTDRADPIYTTVRAFVKACAADA